MTINRIQIDPSISTIQELAESINNVLDNLYNYIDDIDSIRKFNERGGFMIQLINNTGSNSKKGTIVSISTIEQSVSITPADDIDAIGVIYSDGIPNGSMVWVVVSGPAQVLLEDSTSSTVGNWVKVSDTQAGRADATNTAPPGGTITALEDHFSEIGHCLENVTAGTDVLAWIHLHFN